jgi:hypothetical protein
MLMMAALKMTSWGMLIRDHQGNDIYAATKFEDVRISPTLVEATGLRWSLNLAKGMRYENLAVELDAETVVQCLNVALKLAEKDTLISDCMNLMSSMINFRVSFICRPRNVAAHSLVGLAKSIGSKRWVGNVPEPTPQLYGLMLCHSNEMRFLSKKK